MKQTKTQQYVKNRIVEAKEVKGKYMMATTAYHQIGDIGSDEPDLCYVTKEHEKYWIGNWVTGFGFINVLFPKETTRELTPKEIEKYNKTYVQLNNYEPQKLKVD